MNLALAALLTVLAQAPGQAPTGDAQAQAKTRAQALLSDGMRLYEKGDFSAALTKFTDAHGIYPSPKLWFNIAQANRDLGRQVEALKAFETFLDEAKDASPDTTAEARASVVDLQGRLGRIRVEYPTADAEVTIDGKRVGVTPLAGSVWVVPGHHRVQVNRQGVGAVIQETDVLAGTVQTAVFEASPLMAAPSAPPVPAARAPGREAIVLADSRPQEAQADQAEPSSLGRKWWFWAGIGGVVVLGVVVAIAASSGGGTQVPETTLGAWRAFR